jgi:hypothetical protein
MWRELVEIKRRNPGRGGFPNPVVASSPFYELPLCNEYLDIPRNSQSLKQWMQDTRERLQEREGKKISDADLEHYAWDQIDELHGRLQQGLFAPPEAQDELPEYLTLDQCGALVNRSARSMERYKKKGMPRPAVLGGGGKPHEYRVDEMRPWLEKIFNRRIPDAAIRSAIQKFRHLRNA